MHKSYHLHLSSDFCYVSFPVENYCSFCGAHRGGYHRDECPVESDSEYYLHPGITTLRNELLLYRQLEESNQNLRELNAKLDNENAHKTSIIVLLINKLIEAGIDADLPFLESA